jgi:16S rRNA (uracil1498-N3)-methyltransferase
MSRYEFHMPRLYVDAPLAEGVTIALTRDQANHLVNVLRLARGDELLLFNGRDGEWRARLVGGKKANAAEVGRQTRSQSGPGNLHFLFAPLKHARLDYVVQKAVEMGASRLQPIITRHTQVARVNLERMAANCIEAAQQCGILNVAEIMSPLSFDALMAPVDPGRLIIFCDEDAEVTDPVAALAQVRAAADAQPALAVLIGPEGGFAEEERVSLLKRPKVVRLSLGPRILRADTAAVAALALVQAVLGDWRGK